MSDAQKQELGKALWSIADTLRGSMNADDFRDYMLSFLFLRHLSSNYETVAKKELGTEYTTCEKEIEATKDDEKAGEALLNQYRVPLDSGKLTPLRLWYAKNPNDTYMFEEQMRRKLHFVIKPEYLWSNIYELARTQSEQLLKRLQEGFKFIENESFEKAFHGLFSELNLDSEKLGKSYSQRNKLLMSVITTIAEKLAEFDSETDVLGDAYEYLIAQFASGAGQKAGEFYTPQKISDILSQIVIFDGEDPKADKKKSINNLLDFACGSGSLLINVKRHFAPNKIGQIYGQEKNITTYNLARMNMLLHGCKDSEFQIFHGDSLLNDWNILNDINPANRMEFDAIVANPPFSYKWEHNDEAAQDFRFKDYGLAPKSAADFAFLLHGFHFLSEKGTMAIIMPHGVLFRGNVEEKIRRRLLIQGYIDAVIGLPSNLFFSTGIPVCILVLKKCKTFDDVLFINASEYYNKEKKKNTLSDEHVQKIIQTYKERKEEAKYSRRVTMEEIKQNEYNLNITRYIDTLPEEEVFDVQKVARELKQIEGDIKVAKDKHNAFLKELGLEELP